MVAAGRNPALPSSDGRTITLMTSAADLARRVRTDTHLRREAYSMSLYVSIVLFSALLIFDDQHPPSAGDVFLLELGTTVGLVLAHAFASWVSTVITGDATGDVETWDLLKVQIGGALIVAGLAMMAVILAPTSLELPAARLTVALLIAAQVFFETRATHPTHKAVLYGALALVAGVTVAAAKSLLSHLS